MTGFASRMVTAQMVTMAASGGATWETLSGGRSMTWQCGEFSAGVVWPDLVTLKMVTANLWWRARRFPSSRIGTRWPMPGLESRTACALEVSMKTGSQESDYE